MGVTAERRSVMRLDGDQARNLGDNVAVESPLTVICEGRALVTTMRTPGHDLELVAGWLVHEAGVRHDHDITRMGAFASRDEAEVDTVRVELADAIPSPRAKAFITSSSCGVCSSDVLAAVPAPVAPLMTEGWSVDSGRVHELIEGMRSQQRMFERTGALHAAGLVDPEGEFVVVREDVGRHNAVDKVVGHALLHDRAPLTDHVLVVSGRVSYEIVCKALAAGVAAIVAVSGPTTLAVDLARHHDLILIGFARDDRMNIYSGHERVRVGVAS